MLKIIEGGSAFGGMQHLSKYSEKRGSEIL